MGRVFVINTQIIELIAFGEFCISKTYELCPVNHFLLWSEPIFTLFSLSGTKERQSAEIKPMKYFHIKEAGTIYKIFCLGLSMSGMFSYSMQSFFVYIFFLIL